MVRLSAVFRSLKKGDPHFGKLNFMDKLRLHVKGGTGGMGLPRFGGIGGAGGNVYVVATEGQTLHKLHGAHPSKRFVAGKGKNSSTHAVLGNPGKDILIPIPVGISALTDNKRHLGDANKIEDIILIAHGGAGGDANNQYCGQVGQSHTVTLDLKLLADVGLVGFPNAGKSTLLAGVSRAQPKIASYPFTTIRPTLGILEYEDFRRISMADLPGLIEGAHMNIGMGHKFLKHVERTKLLLFVIDINGFQLGQKYEFRSAFETVLLLNKELELYKEELLDKPAVLAVNKTDTENSEEKLQVLLQKLKGIKDAAEEFPEEIRPNRFVEFDDVIPISAKLGYNTTHLRNRLRSLLDFHADLDRDERYPDKRAY